MSERRQSYQRQRQRDSERKRRAILRAAGQCFACHGFRKASVADIAQQAAVSKGLVFHLFGSKSQLFDAAVVDGLGHWAQLSRHRAADNQHSVDGELRSLFLTSFDFIEQHPVISLFSHSDDAILAAHKPAVAQMNKRWRRRIKQVLKLGVAQSVLRADLDIARTTRVFHELQAALLQRVSLHEVASRLDRATVELAIDIFLRGIMRLESA